jgi:predicted flap endonuclease-1-like 5' DNA nuclease
MTDTTLTDIATRYDQFLTRLQQQARASVKKRADRGDVVSAKARMLVDLNARLVQARTARRVELERLDAQIGGLAARAKNLEVEIKRDKEHLSRADSGQRKLDESGTKPGAAGIADIQGVGKVAQKKLQEQGIDSRAGVARMKPEDLAKVLNINLKRAQGIIKAARAASP